MKVKEMDIEQNHEIQQLKSSIEWHTIKIKDVLNKIKEYEIEENRNALQCMDILLKLFQKQLEEVRGDLNSFESLEDKLGGTDND